MTSENLHLLTANKAISLIKEKEISVLDLVNALIDRTEKINPKTRAWVHLNYNQSRECALKFDKLIKSKQSIDPLNGILIGIKDIFNTSDFPTEMGSPLWKNFTPGNDARVIYNIKMANGIIFGKTETAEFAVHTLGNSQNPYDSKRSPGTSSSGSAIAVATHMVPLALGTQTAGSIIRPASFCGVYGFKPSFGLIPRTGMLKTTDSLDQIGFFAKSPEDLQILFDVIRVKGRDYPLSNTILNNIQRQNIINRKWKIKFVKTSTWKNTEDYVKRNIEKFINKLKEFEEFDIEELSLPQKFDSAHKMHELIYTKSLSYYFKEELKNETLVSKIFYEFAQKAKNISIPEYDFAIKYQSNISRDLDEEFCHFDIIISLSTAGYAPFRGEKEMDDPSLIWTMCGVPTINIPAFHHNDLPFGVQIISRRYNDILLLQFLNLLYEKKIISDAPSPKI